MIIVFFGPPGSGKGTQAQELKKTIKDLLHVSTGDLLRLEVASQSELGRSIQAKMEAGDYVTDDVVMQLVSNVIKENVQKDIIFDGFPRTLKQAIAFDGLLGVENLKVDIVFDFDIDEDLLIKRISGRYICLECGAVYHDDSKKPKIEGVCDQCGSSHFDRRADDTEEALKTRLKVYQEQTMPVKQYYIEKNVLKKIDASLSQEKVMQFINTTLSKVGLMRGEY